MSIFWDFSNYDKVELLPCPIITTGTQDMGNGVYKLAAGTPLKKSTRAVSNDANADCVVAEDYFFISTKADQSKLVPVITKGYVDKAKAEASWGGTFAEAAVSALETAGIVLVDGALPSGGGLPEVSASDNDDVLTVVDGAWAAAAPSGGGGLKVGITRDGGIYAMDQTAGDIYDTFEAGIMPVFVCLFGREAGLLATPSFYSLVEGVYTFTVSAGEDSLTLTAASGSDHPTTNSPK